MATVTSDLLSLHRITLWISIDIYMLIVYVYGGSGQFSSLK